MLSVVSWARFFVSRSDCRTESQGAPAGPRQPSSTSSACCGGELLGLVFTALVWLILYGFSELTAKLKCKVHSHSTQDTFYPYPLCGNKDEGGVSDTPTHALKIQTPVAHYKAVLYSTWYHNQDCHMYPASTLLSYDGGESRPSDVDGAWGLDMTSSVS